MKKLFFVLFISLSANISLSQDATLEETLDWVKGKLEGFSYSFYGTAGINHWNRYKYKMSYDECELTIIEEFSYTEDAPWSRNDYTRKYTYVFKLSELKSIEYNDNYDQFEIKTFNDKKVIVKDGDHIQNELKIKVTDLGDIKGEPERFLKAWRHAMELCGAKKEAF